MSGTKMFSDMDGKTFELGRYAVPISNADFAAKFSGVKAKRYDGFSMRTARAEDGRYLPVTRIINYKKNPSKHVCDARCLNASGKTMNCECACGGLNHGRGFALEVVG